MTTNSSCRRPGPTSSTSSARASMRSFASKTRWAGSSALFDDSGGGTNARILFRPRIPGVYRIIATTFEDNKLGAYSLTIREE